MSNISSKSKPKITRNAVSCLDINITVFVELLQLTPSKISQPHVKKFTISQQDDVAAASRCAFRGGRSRTFLSKRHRPDLETKQRQCGRISGGDIRKSDGRGGS